MYLELGEHLFRAQHLLVVTVVVEASVEHTLLRVKPRRLFEIPHFQVTPEDDFATVVSFMTRDNRQQRGFPHAVLRYQTNTLTLAHRKRDVLEECQCAKGLCQVLNVEVGNHGGVLTLFNLLVDAVDVVEYLVAACFLFTAGYEIGGQFLPHIPQGVHILLHVLLRFLVGEFVGFGENQ